MFDTIQFPAQLRGTCQTVPRVRAERFVDGEHTAADERTRQIILQLLAELGVLKDATPFLTADGEVSKVSRRIAKNVDKQVCFMASLLRVAIDVDRFGILMNRNYWVGTPCGYSAARTIIKALLDNGYIRKVVKPRKGQGSVYRCSETFRDRLADLRDVLNFKRARPHPVEVREPKKDYFGSYKKKRLPLDRLPSLEVRHHQETVIRLNDHLSRHPLVDAMGKPLDTALRRIFTGDLNSGGRVYADYQRIPEEDRLRCFIDGEPVCEIDLKASHVAILAALYQHSERPPQDPYAAIDWVDTPLLRKAAKTLVQSVIYADDGRPTRFPRQPDCVPFRDKYELGDTKITDLLPGIFDVMPFLDGSPCLTLPLQFIEAEVLIVVLECCRLWDIPAFPIHDSLLVKQSDEKAVLRVLQDTLRDFLGPLCPLARCLGL